MPGIELRVAGILVRDGKTLLVKHKKPSASYWVVPGGRVEFGETMTDALEREFREELSMKVAVGELLFVNDAVPADGSRHVVNTYFLVSSGDEVSGDRLDEVEDARFFGPGELAGVDIRPPIEHVLRDVIERGATGKMYLGNLWP